MGGAGSAVRGRTSRKTSGKGTGIAKSRRRIVRAKGKA